MPNLHCLGTGYRYCQPVKVCYRYRNLATTLATVSSL